MSRLTVYFLFWIQLLVLVAGSFMTGLNSALGDIDNGIIWGLATIAIAVCEFLVFREMLNKIKPRRRRRQKAKKPANLDPYGPSA